MRNEQWERWNPKIREGLIGLQVKDDTCAKGSWDPFSPVPDIWAERAGRLYLTSLSILTLEVYYRYLPLYRTADDDQEKMDSALKGDDDGADDEKKPDPAKKKAEAKADGKPQSRQPANGQAKPAAGGLEVKGVRNLSSRKVPDTFFALASGRVELPEWNGLVEDELGDGQAAGVDRAGQEERIVALAGMVHGTPGHLAYRELNVVARR